MPIPLSKHARLSMSLNKRHFLTMAIFLSFGFCKLIDRIGFLFVWLRINQFQDHDIVDHPKQGKVKI